MDRGARYWVTNFSEGIDPMLLYEIFQTPFSTTNNVIKLKLKIKENLPADGTPETHTLCKSVVVEYLNVWFR